jgi:predicted TIM-barrel fold metal-dependent hydrolase
MDRLEIERALVCPMKPLSYRLDEANQALAAGVGKHPDRLYGAVRLDPWQPSAAELLRQGIQNLSMKAVYLNPWEEHFHIDLDRLDILLDIACQHHLPVIIATGYPWMSEALQVCALALRWREVPIVMTNGGQINISGLGQADVTLAMQKAPNLYFDTAGVYRQDFIEESVQEFGAQRILFGSGAPYFDQRYEVQRVLKANVSESDRAALQSRNALRLLGLAGRD